jgi:hypothetical protein
MDESEKCPAKGALIVKVEEIYYSTGDEKGGQKIWKRKLSLLKHKHKSKSLKEKRLIN